MIDRVIDYQLGDYMIALKNVTINEEFFNGHFPHKPVMPGVLMVEALAQTAAVLSFMSMNKKPDENSVVYFLGIDDLRFKKVVEPGDQLKMEVKIVRHIKGVWKYDAIAKVDDQIAVKASLMCTLKDNP